ncbi:MAG: hypothetical protein DI598_17000, partial [Pseudopedobacter saltans]
MIKFSITKLSRIKYFVSVFINNISVYLHKVLLMEEKQVDPISVLHFEMEPQSSAGKKHNFYEFIFFKSGTGNHRNHDINNPFESGDLFFVKPNEVHSFQLDTKAEIYILRFGQTARLILKELTASSNGRAVSLSKVQSPLNPKVHFEGNELELFISIFQLLFQLYSAGIQNESLCYYQILCLITIIERNLSYQSNKQTNCSEKPAFARILEHIHRNLKEPEMLTMAYISDKFNVSINTLGNYFKKEIKVA